MQDTLFPGNTPILCVHCNLSLESISHIVSYLINIKSSRRRNEEFFNFTFNLLLVHFIDSKGLKCHQKGSDRALLVVGFYRAYFSRIFLSCVILLLFTCSVLTTLL